MELKSFDEFKKSLTQEDFDYIYGINDEDSLVFETTLGDPEAFTKLATLVSAFSFKMNIRLLALYHKWLAEQI